MNAKQQRFVKGFVAMLSERNRNLLERLTDQEHRFVLEYVGGASGEQAAIRAGCVPEEAGDEAHRLLRLPSIRCAIGQVRDAWSESQSATVQ